MSKVLVDRELLTKAAMIPSKESPEANRRDIVERGKAQADIRATLAAQSAESEGVGVRLRRVIDEVKAGFVVCQRCGDQEDTATLDCVPELEAIAAALSAVTAERDRLREQCNLNDMVHGTKGRERVAALLAQVEELRKDAAAGAVVWKFIDRMGDPAECDPAEDILAEFVAAFDAALAAKEA